MTMRRRGASAAYAFGLLVRLVLALLAAYAAPAAAADDNPARLEAVALLEDPGAALSASEVATRVAERQRRAAEPARPSFNIEFSRSAWWVGATLVNRAATRQPMVLAIRDARVDRADFYVEHGGQWTLAGRFPARDGSLGEPVSRYPVLAATLDAGERLPVLVRVTSRKELKLAPSAFTRDAWHAYELRAAMWDFGFLGGLLALMWCALLIGFFSRSGTFAVLALLALGTALFEATYRGYTALYLWPGAYEWSARAEMVSVYLSLACFIAFILLIADREKTGMPMRAAYLVFLAFECVGMAGAACGDLLTFTWLSLRVNAALAVMNISLALILAFRRTPTARVMLIAISFAGFNMLIRVLDARGAIPGWLPWLRSDIYPNPVIAIIGLATHLLVLAAWINHVGRQRTEARKRLEHWQLTEQDRLRDEVAKRTVALNDALQEVKTHMQQKIETLGYVSHDLRAPLSTIHGYAKLLLQTATPGQARLIRSIDRSIRYQLTLIDELLQYTRAELQPLGIAPDATDLPGLLDDIGDYALALCAQQNNRFDYRPLTPLPRKLTIDGIRLQQVLLNLLSNASKFTRDGTVTLSIGAYRQAGAWRLVFEVADTGIGIELDQTTDIFRAYRQVQAVNGGTGLGLFIAQRIVGAMNGELAVSSQPGVGTSFTFQIVAPALGHALIPASALARTVQPAEQIDLLADARGMRCPPDDALDELIVLAGEGRLTDIEEWLGQHAPAPRHAAFVHAVRERLDTLDLQAIERLAAALKHTGIVDAPSAPSLDAEPDLAGPA